MDHRLRAPGGLRDDMGDCDVVEQVSELEQKRVAYSARALDAGVFPPFRAVVDGLDGWPICHCNNLAQAQLIASSLTRALQSRPADALEEALEPFAKLANEFDDQTDEQWVSDVTVPVTIGDCRRARAAISARQA